MSHNLLICTTKMVRLFSATGAKVFTDGRFGEGPKFSLFQYFRCSSDGGETDLSKCTLYTGCGSECHSHHIGIRCFSKDILAT